VRRWNPWYVAVSAALIYALSWLVGDEPMDALVNAALAGLCSLLIVEYSDFDGAKRIVHGSRSTLPRCRKRSGNGGRLGA
jgi:hypothetical protein